MDLRLSLGLRLKAVIHLKCSEWQLRAQSHRCCKMVEGLLFFKFNNRLDL